MTEQEVFANAQRYDLAALIAALRGLGYSDDAIEFRSNQTTLHQAAVIDSVCFLREPSPRAIVTVNLSLLSPQSPLPTYFQKILEEESSSSTLSGFLNFFSHRLIRGDVLGMFPDRDPSLFQNFSQTKRQLLSLLGWRSLSTTHWIFQSVFPELEVAIRRTVLARTLRTRGLILGEWTLGDGSVAGGTATVPTSAIGVTLYCDEPVTGTGEPWGNAAKSRLHGLLFPLLRSHGFFLEVQLVFRDQSSFLVLSEGRFLGYEPIYAGEGPPEPDTRSCRTVILWSGELPSRERAE